MSLEDLLKLATWALAIPAAVTAFLQWRRTQIVGRTTAAVERVRSFYETPGTRNAMMILKNPHREIPLWDRTCPPKEGPYTVVTWDDAKWALIPTSRNAEGEGKLTAIRDSFEDFMDRLTQTEMFIEAGLLTAADVKHLVLPWARRLGGASRRFPQVDDGGLSRNFRVYVEYEDRIAVQKLFHRYGIDIRARIERDIAEFRKELDERLLIPRKEEAVNDAGRDCRTSEEATMILNVCIEKA